ncbi:hypothetical protein EON65_38405 [archaeon]|nr:MAG: hypothetical protein EON65_38405 [archaeon]
MSHLILHWLNEEVRISRHVDNFSEDFKDGYLLGEILFRFNQQLNFSEFVADETPQATLKNMQLIEPTLRRIGVKFNSRIASEILRGEERATKNLLYQLKIALENLRRNSGTGMPESLRNTRSDKVLHVVMPTKAAFEETTAKTFQIAVRNALENPNSAMLEKAVKKYTDRAEDYYKTISMGESLDQATLALNRTRAKDIYKSRREHEGEFAEAWNSINLDQWRKNQKTAHDRREHKHRVIEELTRRKTVRQEKLNLAAKDNALQSIDQFEERMKTMILSKEEDNGPVSPKFVRTIRVENNVNRASNVLKF